MPAAVAREWEVRWAHDIPEWIDRPPAPAHIPDAAWHLIEDLASDVCRPSGNLYAAGIAVERLAVLAELPAVGLIELLGTLAMLRGEDLTDAICIALQPMEPLRDQLVHLLQDQQIQAVQPSLPLKVRRQPRPDVARAAQDAASARRDDAWRRAQEDPERSLAIVDYITSHVRDRQDRRGALRRLLGVSCVPPAAEQDAEIDDRLSALQALLPAPAPAAPAPVEATTAEAIERWRAGGALQPWEAWFQEPGVWAQPDAVALVVGATGAAPAAVMACAMAVLSRRPSAA